MIKLNTKKTFWRQIALICVVVLFFCEASQSQAYRANHWVFPTYNGLDFSSGTTVIGFDSLTGNKGTSAISDANGDLILYSNGQTVWGANGIPIQGGVNLLGSPQAAQSSILLPVISNPDRYYLFTVDVEGVNNGMNHYLIDLSVGSAGIVLPFGLLIDSCSEKIAATKHANDAYYWVLGHRWESDEFHAFLVDSFSVNTAPVVSAVGFPHLNMNGAGEDKGQMKFSPDGTKVAVVLFSSARVQIFDFDNTTGIVSNPITLSTGNPNFIYGIEFSADSKKVYFGEAQSNGFVPINMHVFDLDHVSEDCLLASEEIFTHNDLFKGYRDLQLGIDGKIYMGYYTGGLPIDTIGVINNPELMGPSRQYVMNGQLLANSYTGEGGLTNFASSYMSDGIFVEFGTNCEGIATQFSPDDTAGIDSVQWNFGDPSSSQNTSSSINASHVFSNANDTFNVSLTTFSGNQSHIFTRNVFVWDRDLNLLGNDTTVCSGQPVTLDATWFNACIEWSDGSTNNTISTSTEGWYWADISYQSCLWRDSVYVTEVTSVPQFSLGNDTGVCTSVNFVLDPDLQDAFYTWQDGSNDTVLAVSSTGIYWLEASNACGSNRDSLIVTVNEAAQPILNFPEDTTICDTVPLILDVTFIGATYNWNDGFAGSVRTIETTGIYAVTVSNICGVVSDSLSLIVQNPIESLLNDREVFCGIGDTLIIVGLENSSNTIWSTGRLNDTIEIVQEGIYSVTGFNTCGNLNDTIEVLLWNENYSLTIGNDQIVCDESTTVVVGDSIRDFPFNYSWSNGQSDALAAVGTGEYSVTATNRCATLNSQISVSLASPITIITADDYIICPGESKEVSLSAAPISSIKWNHGPATETIILTSAGNYSADIIDTNGCAFTSEIMFTDSCPGIVGAGNIFTPNGDGINDKYCIDLQNVVEYTISIFDRWGIEVFYSRNNSKCWDGESIAGEGRNGTYFYVVEVEDALGETTSYRGSFTLVR